MVEETQSLTMQGTGYTSKQLTVPADVQREEGIAIDDEVEVQLHGVSDIIDQASFTARQTGGDRVTVPAVVVEQLGIVAGEEYDVAFSAVEDDEIDGAIPDEDVADDEDVEEAIEEAESEMDELLDEAESEMEDESAESEGRSSTADAQSESEEEDEPGLGELFG
jgi:hypothetical protein